MGSVDQAAAASQTPAQVSSGEKGRQRAMQRRRRRLEHWRARAGEQLRLIVGDDAEVAVMLAGIVERCGAAAA